MTETVSELSVQELKELVREAVEEVLLELVVPDPDSGLDLRPEAAERLRESRKAARSGDLRPLSEVKRRHLGDRE